MTQLRKCKCGISNYFDDVLRGIGHRGSSFSDVDAVTHDERTDRYLFQEFKQSTEPLSIGQRKLLKGLARLDFITVWCVRKRDDGAVDWYDVGLSLLQTITVEEYQRRFSDWWNGNAPSVGAGVIPPARPPAVASEVPQKKEFPKVGIVPVDEINW